MQPCWVITFLADEGELSNSSFAQTLDEHLSAWSRVNDKGCRWWTIENYSDEVGSELEKFVETLLKHLRNPLHRENGIQPAIQGDIDATNLSIALVGDVTIARTRTFLHCLAGLLRLRSGDLFHGTTINITALLHLPLTTPPELKEDVYRFSTELQTQLSDDVAARRPFDSVLFFQERNQVSDNRDGYVSLTPEQVRQSMAQSLFHMMLGKGPALKQLKQTHRTEIASMGAAAVYYDWNLARRKLAEALGRELMDDFAGGRQSPFVDVEQARSAAREVAFRTDVKRMFQQLALGPGRPQFSFGAKAWEGAKSRKGKAVSAWALLSKQILYVYFSVFLKNLPFRISEYARMFLHSTFEQFEEFLRARRVTVWEGSEDPPEEGLRKAVRTAVAGVFEGRFGGARTLGQVEQAAEEIKKVCEPAQVLSRLAQVEEFARLEVFAVPDFLRPYYDGAESSLSAEEEEALYRRLVDTIRFHPMPAALFLRASVVGILLALIIVPALDLISPGVLNLEWLLAYPSLVQMVAGILPLAIAFWRYRFKAVMLLRKQLLAYVAAVLKHAQSRARDMVRREMASLLGEARAYCDEIKEWAGDLGEEIAYPAGEVESYRSTWFQREVFEGFEVPGQAGAAKAKVAAPSAFALEVAGQQKPFEQFSGIERNVFLHQMLDSETGGIALWEMFSDLIPLEKKEAESDEQEEEEIDEEPADAKPDQVESSLDETGRRWREIAEGLYQEVSKRQLDGFMEEAIAQKMKSLAFPPVVIAAGVNARGAIFEWKYGAVKSLASVSGADCSADVPGTSLASLAGYRPIERITDISLIRTFAQSVDGTSLRWDDLPSLFVAATVRLPGEKRPGLKNLSDGKYLPFEAFQQKIADLQQKLGLVSPLPSQMDDDDKEKTGVESPKLEI